MTVYANLLTVVLLYRWTNSVVLTDLRRASALAEALFLCAFEMLLSAATLKLFLFMVISGLLGASDVEVSVQGPINIEGALGLAGA